MGSITGTDPEQFYAVAHDWLSPVFGIDPSHTDTDNAYLGAQRAWRKFANMAEQLHLAQQLQQHGEQIVSSIDAEAGGATASASLRSTTRTVNPPGSQPGRS